jgi:hypothetical protein
MLRHISTLLLPSHVQNDELAQRFRNEKYTVRMSRSGFSLLVGWLTEGVGGEAFGAGGGFSGEQGKRGRASVMRVVNNHLRFDGQLYLMRFQSLFTLIYSDFFQSNFRFASCMGRIDGASFIIDTTTEWVNKS